MKPGAGFHQRHSIQRHAPLAHMVQHIGIVSFGHSANLYHRMLPDFPGRLEIPDGDSLAQFHFSHELDSADWFVVAHLTSQTLTTHIPIGRRVLVLGEPSPAADIGCHYANQFGLLVSPYPIPGYLGTWVPSHGALPWFFGGQDETLHRLSDLETLRIPPKTPTVSAVISTKVIHEGHRQRLRFVDRLQDAIGDRLHLYGRGIQPIDDKADAILPHAYHLSLENTMEPNYWTEKISDAFLGYAMPIYVGCPNITKWFSGDSLVQLSLTHLEEAVQKVCDILDSDLHAQRMPAILESRDRVLHHETLFHVLARTIASHPNEDAPLNEPQTLHTKPKRTWRQKVAKEWNRTYHKLTFRR